MEELLKQILTSMDENFHQVLGEIAALRSEISTIRSEMATKRDVAEMRNAFISGTRSFTELMAGVTGQSLSLTEEMDNLRRRMQEIEKRLPPEAA